jgi:hypothetical protein
MQIPLIMPRARKEISSRFTLGEIAQSRKSQNTTHHWISIIDAAS